MEITDIDQNGGLKMSFTMDVTDTEKIKKDIVEQDKPVPEEITELKKTSGN